MAEDNRGWHKQPTEHGLAARGIPTKQSEPRTPTRQPTTPKTSNAITGSALEKENERILQLFADRNYSYEIPSGVDNNGIWLKSDQLETILDYAIPNGCGSFTNENIIKLSEVYGGSARFMIRRDDDGSVLVLVKGDSDYHPGQIREFIGSDYATSDDKGVITYKWAPIRSEPAKTSKKEIKISKDDRALLLWAEEVKTGQTDKSFPEWIKEGEE